MQDFVSLPIVEVRTETRDAISVRLAVPAERRAAFAWRPGQHVPVRITIAGEELRRTYSISSGPDDDDLQITIKRHEHGRVSAWAHANLRAGMTLDVMPPAGRFVLPAATGEPRHLLAIAAGAGITPIFAMVQAALATEPGSQVTLIYGNRTMADAIFAGPLEDLKDRHLGRLTLLHVLSREDGDSPALSGRITPDRLRVLMRAIGPASSVAHAFLCGPGAMIRDARATLLAVGLPPERIHHEFFAPIRDPVAPGQPAPTPDAGAALPADTQDADLTVIVDGARHRVPIRPDEAVLDAAIRAGLRVPFSCKAGMCCTCRGRIVEGAAAMRVNYSLEPWEIERGFTLTCQAVPAGGRLVVDYDQM